jgi:hypothetical protein
MFAKNHLATALTIGAAAGLNAPTAADPPPCSFSTAVAYGAGSWPRSVAVGDLDGDLDLDLAVANNQSLDVSVLMNRGDGTFVEPVAYPIPYDLGPWPQSVAIDDLDRMAGLDLAVADPVAEAYYAGNSLR